MPGSIRKRGRSSWTVVVDLGKDPVTGKRRQLLRSVTGPKRDAEAMLVQLLHERDTGVERPRGKLTVAEYLARWLRDYVEPTLAPKTADTYRMAIRAHLVPALGSLELVALRPSHIQSLYTRMLTSGRADRKGGLRRGELLGLRWQDIDLAHGSLHIQQTAQRIHGQGIVFRQPKTRLSRRSIALSPDAVAVLRKHRRQQAERRLLAGPAYQAHDLVFATGLGPLSSPATSAVNGCGSSRRQTSRVYGSTICAMPTRP